MVLKIILNRTNIIIFCNIVITYYFWIKKSVMIWLICDFLLFYAHVHTCCPSYTDEEQETNVDSETVCPRLLIIGLVVHIKLCILSIPYP